MLKNLRLLLLLTCAVALPAFAAEIPHHQLRVELDPERQHLAVIDEIRLPATLAGREIDFLLNRALAITESSVALEPQPLGDVAPFFSINAGGEDLGGVELARYRVSVPADAAVRLVYAGTIGFGLGEQKEEYTRGFRETAGLIGNEGVFLAGTSFWVPRFDDGFLSFALEAHAPAGWHLVSQGSGSSGEGVVAHWQTTAPMEEVYLVGGPLVAAHESAGAVELLVYLRERDDALAGKYLEIGAQYLEMYRELLGPYPYEKFAVVENFWETGYGMPSFTLLGPTVIRFPFILHSSYPHEILHNWWGNSVYVDLAGGNWCEGLTAYLADHLIQEQRGKGAEHRRATLQKYRDYVKEGRDFPLREFRSRHSAATEAVGYGKTMMGFHTLRRRLGDEVFIKGLRQLYRDQRGTRASFSDIQAIFSQVSGQDLQRFFTQWVERAGAPRLGVVVEPVRAAQGGGWVVAGRLVQLQDGEPFAVEVPVVIETAAGVERAMVSLGGDNARFELKTTARPLALHVDPDFDLFRWLDPRETPPSIGQIFGEPEILAVLPAAEGAEAIERYRGLIAAWQSDAHHVETRLDDELAKLPKERAIWLLGRRNRFAGELFEAGAESLHLEGETVPFAGHSLVVVRRHPESIEKAVGWLVVEPAEAFEGMARKLPHYGKYSYLAFEGAEPTNTVKGEGSATDSPLRIDLRGASARATPLPPPVTEKRRALAELPPVFSQKTLAAHVAFLAAPEREGRGPGSRGLGEAVDYVVRQLTAAGLKPGVEGGFLQRFAIAGSEGKPVEVANLIGVIPGSREDWREQSVVVSAHLDHLGRGWPDVHQGDEGVVHPGADDNASGVAVLLELARVFAAGERPARSIVFVAFTAEEAGRLGSKHFVEHPPLPLAEVRSAINLDTVGRLGGDKLGVLGGATAEEWPHIFRGCSFVTGVESRMLPGSAEGSDQWSLIEKGIPAVQITTGPHTDYHRPGDTLDKVDVTGLVKVATFVKEAVGYLAERPEPLKVTIAGSTSSAPAAATPTQGRRVSLGTVPDFGFAGPGVKLGGVVPGSPAEKAGLAEGDVLVRLGDHEIPDLRAFSEQLKTLSPGQTVRVTVRRGEQELSVEVTVQGR